MNLESAAKKCLNKKPQMMKLCQHIIDRFFVNSHYALQQNDGNYYVARKNIKDTNSNLKITPEKVYLGLKGVYTIGTYTTSKNNPTIPDDMVKFIAFDFDSKTNGSVEEKLESLKPKVNKLLKLLDELGFEPMIEFSGRKGYHVFLFFETPVSSKKAYAVGRYLGDKIEKGMEVFPKQSSIKNLILGSQIKLPLSWHRRSKQRSILIDRDFQPIKQQYNALLNAPYNSHAVLDKLYEQIREYNTKKAAELKQKLSSTATGKIPTNVVINGPSERHQKQFIFVVRCFENGLSPEQTLKEGTRWLHANQDKFNSSLDWAERELANCIEHVWKQKLGENVDISCVL